MTTATLTREAPAQAPWQLDPTHTEVEFSVRHLMIANVKGRFANVAGSLALDETDPRKVALDVQIPVATVDTRNEQRDAHLRSADFFDAEQQPLITFMSRRVTGDVYGAFKLHGDLTIRGVTHPVTLDVILEGRGGDPWGNERLGYQATGKIDRRDFGLTWNQALETGGVAVGHEVKIIINTELVRPLKQS